MKRVAYIQGIKQETEGGVNTLIQRHSVNINELLQYNVLHGEIEMVRELLKTGADIFYRDDNKDTLLHTAINGDSEEMLDFLLTKRIPVNALNYSGLSPLHCASCQGKQKMVLMLLDRGANINIQNYELETPLHCAIVCRQGYTVNLLLERGADVRARNLQNRTPLCLAITNNDEEIVKMLLQYGASTCETADNTSVLHWINDKRMNNLRI